MPARSWGSWIVTLELREGVQSFNPDRCEYYCMQCGRKILADMQCGCWWRHLPKNAQAFVLGFMKPRYGPPDE